MGIRLSERSKKIVSSAAFAAIFIILFLGVNALFMDKYSYIKYKDFYGQKENVDVLFLGTSRVINGVDPMELWNDWGIASYNLANYSETIATNYWQLVNALEYTRPKAVVLDIFASHYGYSVNDALLHHFTDSMPLTWTKIRTVADLEEKNRWSEYLFEFSLYHSRWNGGLTMQDIRPRLYKTRGGEIRYNVVPNEEPKFIPKEQYNPMEGIELDYLQKIIALCKSEGIQLVLTYVPYSADETGQRNANYGYVLANENDIPYLDLIREGIEFNYMTDMADEGGHLSALGARKVTNYFGQYLTEKCGIPDRRSDAAYAYWKEDYLDYMRYKEEMINEQDNLMFFLVLLSDRNLKTTVYMGEDSMAVKDKNIAELLKGIDEFGQAEYRTDNAYGEDKVYIEVLDRNTNEVVSAKAFERVEENVWK